MIDAIFGDLESEDRRFARELERKLGFRHDYRISPLAPRPGDSPRLTVTSALDERLSHVECVLIEPTASRLPMTRGETVWDPLIWRYLQYWHVNLPRADAGTVVRYKIEAFPECGGPSLQADEGASFSYYVGDPAPPQWAAEAIIYQIFPDRFHPGGQQQWNPAASVEDIYGGTLRGIIEKLDYIAGLGFNCIWLNPIFPDHTHHGYHATDYFDVNPRLGTREDIDELVSQAHGLGIRLLLDFVANHWGARHPTFQAARAGRDSEYYHWYTWRRWPDEYEMYFRVRDLPKINLEHPAARRHMLDAALYWLTEMGFDGCRLDYALGPSLDFWTDFRSAVHSAKPDAWLFGEVVDMPSEQLKYWGRLHGCLDFMLEKALRSTFALGTMKLDAFDAFLEQHEAYFPSEFSRPSFLDNHDVSRFLWLCGGDKRKLKLAALCQFTLRGSPIVYYGTEVGLSQERDMNQPGGRFVMAEARLPMPWGEAQDADLRAFYNHLIHFRRSHPILWRGRRRTVHLNEAEGTYAYAVQDSQSGVLVAFNLSEKRQSMTVGGERLVLKPLSGELIEIGGEPLIH